MRLGFNGATSMKRADLPKDIEVAALAGYDALEIWGAKLEEYLRSHSVADLGRLFEESKIRPLSINSIEFITFKSGSEWDKVASACHEYCRIAQAIGCQSVVVVPSPRPAGLQDAHVARESVRALRELSSIAGGYGVSLAFEFLGFEWCSVVTLDQCSAIVDEVGRDNVGMVLDTFHFFAGGSELDSISRVNPTRLLILHMSDAEAKPRRELQDADRLFPGDGVIPLRAMLERLRRIGYDGFASVEIFRPEYWEWDPLRLAQTARQKALEVLRA